MNPRYGLALAANVQSSCFDDIVTGLADFLPLAGHTTRIGDSAWSGELGEEAERRAGVVAGRGERPRPAAERSCVR